ncbi:MAG: ABC transporter ATP-binding protein [Actinobacteria bacterium]|nr:ABC transporter ATP-binding protein [Actinomycetota bacterium]
MTPAPTPLLELDGLRVDLRVDGALRRVIHDVSLRLGVGEAVGLVGESGSGKSITARTIMRLLPRGAEVAGDVRFGGRSVLELGARDLRRYRATDVAMIYQDPRAHLNPVRTIGDFLLEGPVHAVGASRADATEAAVALLRSVGIPDAPRRLRQYPHQLSGGLLQRVVIAAALLAEPQLILADEPTTALDVTTQEEVMAILDDQRRKRGVAMLFITHDLDLAAAVTDRLAVMYAGTVAEVGPAADLHRTALHPYTAGLLAARPSTTRVERLTTIPGRPVSAFEVGPGCVFASRCAHVEDRCRAERPALRALEDHMVACHRAEELRGALGLPAAAAR